MEEGDGRKVRWRRISDSYPAVTTAHAKQETALARLDMAIYSLQQRVNSGLAEPLHVEQLRQLELEWTGRFQSYEHLDAILSGDEHVFGTTV